MTTNTCNLARTLRPDVASVVNAHVSRFEAEADERNEWRLYSKAKDAISVACGWDAPAGRYDQQQYDLAMFLFVERTGL